MQMSLIRRSGHRPHPGSLKLLVERGKRLYRGGKLLPALDTFLNAIRVEPRAFEPVYYAGMIAYQLRQYDTALKFLMPAMESLLTMRQRGERLPVDGAGWATLFCNLAQLFRDVGEVRMAHAALREALDDCPTHIESLMQLGHLAMESDDLPAAAQYYGRAMRSPGRGPDDDYSRSFVELMVGDFAKGYRDYEQRWQSASFTAEHQPLRPPAAAWDGSAIDGALCLHREQGFGDCLQMLRFVPWAAARAAQLYLEVHPSMHRLCAESFAALPNVTVVSEGERPDYRATASLLSLPFLAGVKADADIPSAPYLTTHGMEWREGRSIGVCWAGGAKTKHDHRRSMAIDVFSPLLALRPGAFMALQYERIEGIAIGVEPMPPVTDFADTAALIRGLDLVITVDTAVAHLAGAMGVRTWLLVCALPDYRWQLERTDTPWYPSMRIYRQEKYGDWASVIRRVGSDLESEGV